MLEYFLANRVYERFGDKEVKVKVPAPPPKKKASAGSIIATIIFVVLYLAIMLWSASLSWMSNTIAGWGIMGKIVFALFAALFAISYLLTHLIHKYDLLLVIEKLQPSLFA